MTAETGTAERGVRRRGGALAAEWTKIRTLPSTLWTLLTAFVLTVGIAAVYGIVLRDAYGDMDAKGRSTWDPVYSGLNGLTFGELGMVAFAVLVVGAEYSTGTIRASLTAVPRRGLFYASQLLAGTLLSLVVAVVTTYAAFFVSQAGIGPEHNASLGDPGVLRATLGACVYLTLLCLFSMGVAAMLRSSTLSLGVLIPLFFILSEVLTNVSKVKTVAKYLPDEAGRQIMRLVPWDDKLGAWEGLWVMVAWTVAAVAGGYVMLRRREI
ncbi:ABC transporter permease subunit [Streptomyces iconiensis]|uniref:ABC transporter permease subunit n=1 Tax=Streptomyces iconiensis TaxID=1384038 RepID=A0ABT7A2F5_9ACTN|nr:ABC transporter permease subunit [Streptomyces iconiensis]MDJ1135249.1 ABC transporter permease subunit [Streptomyces iconiensis]